jgi:hypothetical protein
LRSLAICFFRVLIRNMSFERTENRWARQIKRRSSEQSSSNWEVTCEKRIADTQYKTAQTLIMSRECKPYTIAVAPDTIRSRPEDGTQGGSAARVGAALFGSWG